MQTPPNTLSRNGFYDNVTAQLGKRLNKTKVISLGRVRDMLAEWEKVRVAILSGGITGFHTGLRSSSGKETIYLGGVFREDPMEAMKAILVASAARTRVEDEPPLFQASSM